MYMYDHDMTLHYACGTPHLQFDQLDKSYANI